MDRAMIERATAGIEADALAVGVADDSGSTCIVRGRLAGSPVRADTAFYSASIMKQLVGYLLAEQATAGAIDPADRLLDRGPELPARFAGIRLGHLLHHAGDLPEVTSGPVPAGNAEVLRRLATAPGDAAPAPGKRFAYSNTGYVLLAEVLARVAGAPVAAVVQERCFGPLGMTSSRLGGKPVHLEGEPDPPGTVGDGGVWTSVADLLRWLVALQSGDLDPAVVRLMTTVTPFAAPGSDYAWGVRVSGGRITHGGSWPGWSAKTVRIPGRSVAVAVLAAGADDDAVSALGVALADLAAGR